MSAKPSSLGWVKHRDGRRGHKYIFDKHTGAVTGCLRKNCEHNQLTSDHRFVAKPEKKETKA